MKFGGTSVADADAMMRVIKIVAGQMARYPDHTRPVVVVSAMSKVTDRLVETGRLAAVGNADEAAVLLHELLMRHVSVAAAVVHGDALDHLTAQLTKDFNGLTVRVR